MPDVPGQALAEHRLVSVRGAAAEAAQVISVLVLVPVLGRPERAKPLVESLRASVSGPVVRADLVFLCSPDDAEQFDACEETSDAFISFPEPTVWTETVPWEAGPGDYARKINYGWNRDSDHDFMLLGADDLKFHPGWLEAAMITQLRTGACVVGTNDLGNRSVMAGEHATHPLVHRNYTCGLVDDPDPGKLLFEGYDHNFCDTEFIGTAKARDSFAPALESHVEHLHPFWGKAPKDDTYTKGTRKFQADSALFRKRRKLWEEA